MGSPGRGPNFIVLQEVFIDKGLNGLDMPDRRHTPNHKAGLLADKIGIGFAQRFANQCFDDFLIHPICAAGDDQNRPFTALCLENQRLDNLGNLATDCLSCLNRCSGGLRQLDHLKRKPSLPDSFLDSLCTGTELLVHLPVPDDFISFKQARSASGKGMIFPTFRVSIQRWAI